MKSVQPIPTQPGGTTLSIFPKSAKFQKDADWFGKMDPFTRVKIGDQVYETEVAKAFGKTPVWKTPLIFKLTSEQASQPDKININFEVLDKDSSSSESLGTATFTLSQLKGKTNDTVTLKLLDKSHKQTGTIEVTFEYIASAPVPQGGAKQMVGTVFLKLGEGKLDLGVPNTPEITLSFIHNGIACQTGIEEAPGKKPAFKNNAIFQLYDGEDMNLKCVKVSKGKEEIIGEAQVQLASLSKRDSLHNIAITLMKGNKKSGEMTLEIEFFTHMFVNPVKIYPPMQVKKGDSIPKKIKYTNPDIMKKSLKIQSDNKNLMLVKTEKLTILPNQTVEIKFDVFAPKGPEEKCRIDIIVEETQDIEESLLFKIKGI